MNLAWSKEKYKDQAKNLLEMIYHYNYVSSWVATALVIIPKLKERAKLFQRLINIAEVFFIVKFSNLNININRPT